MTKPRIRHIALNVRDREGLADYYKKIFGLEEKYRGPNGTIYLSDGFVGIALISRADQPWGINHFGFEVESASAIADAAQATAESNTFPVSATGAGRRLGRGHEHSGVDGPVAHRHRGACRRRLPFARPLVVLEWMRLLSLGGGRRCRAAEQHE